MNELTTINKNAEISPLMDVATFEHMNRVARVLALSPLFPDHLRKGSQEQSIANGILVMNMALRLREDPLTVAQNIYFVGGKPGWSSSYMISKANQHGVFSSPIEWEVKGQGESLSVTAFAEMAATGRRVSSTCDMAMAKAEGWTRNSKYQSMPEHMLRYRSAAFLIRLYCPEVMVGVPAQIENDMPTEMRDITPQEPVDHERGSVTSARQEKPNPAADAMITEEERKAAERREAAAKAEKDAEAEKERLRAAYEAEAGAPADGRWSVDRLREEIGKAKEDAAKRDQGWKAPEDAERETEAPEADTKPASTAPDRDAYAALFDGMVNSLLDGEPVADVKERHADEIEAMQKHFPDMHADLERAFSDAE